MVFTDPRLYVMGVGTGYMADISTGDILYWTDKMQEGNVNFSASDNVLSAGVGNAPAIIIPTDPNITVNVTAGDYSEYVKAASVGASVTPGAPVLTCQQVTASGATLTLDVSAGTPVAGPGMDKVVCYVQEIGQESPVATGGVAYALDPSTGAITGFTAVSGHSYLVTYHAAQANATLTTIGSNIKGKVVRFAFSRPIYTNYDPSTNSGDLWGWVHEIIPMLQLMPDGASNSGSQTSYTTTGITGRALTADAVSVTGGCADCNLAGAPMAYRIVQPCDKNSGIEGIVGVLGGSVSLTVGGTVQLTPAVVVDGKLGYGVPPTDFAYESSATSVATVGASTGIVSAAGTGSSEITITYTVGGQTLTDYVNVEVSAS